MIVDGDGYVYGHIDGYIDGHIDDGWMPFTRALGGHIHTHMYTHIHMYVHIHISTYMHKTIDTCVHTCTVGVVGSKTWSVLPWVSESDAGQRLSP